MAPPAPPTTDFFFSSIDIVFLYVNHNENDIKELQSFSHHHCNPAARVDKLLLKLRMGFWNSQPQRQVPSAWPRRHVAGNADEAVSGTLAHAPARGGREAAHYFWHQQKSCISAALLLPLVSPAPASFRCFVFY